MSNGKDEVVIQGELTHIRIDGDNEFAPSYLGIYLDRFFERDPMILVSPDAQPGTCQFTIKGYIPTGTLLPRDARLVFQSYVSTKNDYGATCVADTGATSIELFGMLLINNILIIHSNKELEKTKLIFELRFYF